MSTPTLLPTPGADPDELFEGFSAWAAERGLELYPAQDEALIELVTGANVIARHADRLRQVAGRRSAPTSRRWPRGERSVYTAPIKALVSEKFFALVRDLRLANVGMLTGDAAVNADAPIICCTAEVLANIALREGRGRRRRPGRHGRVPLLRRPGPRLGVAGAAARAAAARSSC